MLGFYDYTVILTYISLISAGFGIFISLHGTGHPYIGTFFLLFCGLCDAFDGKIARTKVDRTEDECKFGIQIDSLCDLVAFGVLPACIGEALVWNSSLNDVPIPNTGNFLNIVGPVLLFMILMLYVLAAMIRLAYFNVMEEKRQKAENGVRKSYEGLPVTSSALIFPFVMLLQFLTPKDFSIIYFVALTITAFLFVSKISIKKPQMKGIMILVGIGVIEFLILLIVRIFGNINM